MNKNGLIRKIKLISKYMTSQPEKQTIAVHTLSSPISQGNQTITENVLKNKSKCKSDK